MAYSESARAISAVAGGTVAKGRFVVLASDGQMDHAGTAQIAVDGISAHAAAVNESLTVLIPDGALVQVEAGAAVTRGALVATDNAGRCIAWVDSAGNVSLGRAWTAATDAGDLITIQFVHKKTGGGS